MRRKMKLLFSPSRRFVATPSSLLRYMCTAATVEQTDTAPLATAKKVGVRVKRDVLYRKLSAPGTSKGSAFDTLNGFFGQGDFANKYELDSCMLQLRRNGKLSQALEVMEWMQTRNIKFEPADYARHLDLISQVKGISAAEKYFNGLPESAKDISTYGALLSCYCRGKLTIHALDLFEEMDKLQLLSSVAFNNLMSLYMRLDFPEKVPPLVEEMKNRKIPLSILTYNIWITSYACLKDIKAAERVFEEIRHNNGELQYDWTTFSNLAIAYVKAGLYEKAESTLKTLEEEIGKMGKRCGRQPFHYLISLYAGTTNLVKVHEIWKHLKSTFKITCNQSTLSMLEALARLNDVDGYKKIFEEWEATCSAYDKRLPYQAISFYLKHGMSKEAEEVFHNVLKGYNRNAHWLWKRMMPYYLEKRQLDFALGCLETAITLVKNNDLCPTPGDVNRFAEYFKKESDVNNAEKFCKILKKVGLLDCKAYELLLETYVAASKEAPDMRNRIMDDEIEVSPELEELLRRVCIG
ncbi:pentatricopeptide repeat-containing protein At4g01990, mitochondrial-like [Apium graveolens]|uniref:pentatricopeptide repeat-containing protein At4g01990, mitochondrial-like n=1 Tax=Apium graveolens TaxID=4045 RepID=UPI003D7A54F3